MCFRLVKLFEQLKDCNQGFSENISLKVSDMLI